MGKQKVSTWDMLKSHPIAKKLDMEAQLALSCEYIDLYEELQGMSLGDFIVAYFASADSPPADAGASAEAANKRDEPKPGDNGVEVKDTAEDEEDTAKDEEDAEKVVRPASMVGMRIVYRFPGQNILSDTAGVTADTGKTVSFTDVDGESWSNVRKDRIYPISPENYKEIHVTPREAKEFKTWLAGTPSKDHAEGAAIRNLTVEFTEHTDKIMFVIMNGKRPYVDRFVQLPKKNFADDQKPTTRLFGEHCFRVKKKDYVVNVVTP